MFSLNNSRLKFPSPNYQIVKKKNATKTFQLECMFLSPCAKILSSLQHVYNVIHKTNQSTYTNIMSYINSVAPPIPSFNL